MNDDEGHKQFTSSPEQWEKLKPLANGMRRVPTTAEAVLWQRIRNRQISGAKFRRQHAVLGFIVDFVCIERRLIIEVDGGIHEQSDQVVYDEHRQSSLEANGFRVLRFPNADVLQSLDGVAEAIAEALNSG